MKNQEFWVIQIRMPESREKMLFAGVDGEFALVPLGKDGDASGAFCWPTYQEAEKYLKAQLEVAPQLKKLGPFEIERGYGTVLYKPKRKKK